MAAVTAQQQLQFTESIPAPEAIEARLAELRREAMLLRGLLRLSERKVRMQGAEQQGGPEHAA